MSGHKRLILRARRDLSGKGAEPRPIEYDAGRRVFLREGRRVASLAPQEGVVLDVLLERRGTVVNVEAIEVCLWPHARPEHSAGRVRDLLQKLRQHLGDTATQPSLIETISHRGYIFIGEVEDVQAEESAPLTPAIKPREAGQVILEERSAGVDTSERPSGRDTFIFGFAFFALLCGFAWADTHEIYGIACLTLGISVAFAFLTYRGLEDSIAARVALSLYFLAAMAYIPSAVTFTEIIQDVVNMATIPPSFIYPFVTGMKFLPLFVPPFILWCLYPALRKSPTFKWARLRWAYASVGTLFFIVTCFVVLTNSNDLRIWTANIPGVRGIVASYCSIFGINLAAWFIGWYAFEREAFLASRSLPLFLLATYAPVAALGAFIDQSYNDVNRFYLDKRRPAVFLITNPSAMKDVQALLREPRKYGIGPELAMLLSDDAFVRSLPQQTFYKRNFDEPFQIQAPAIIFAFRRGAQDASRTMAFQSIRFPRSVVELLRFQPVQ